MTLFSLYLLCGGALALTLHIRDSVSDRSMMPLVIDSAIVWVAGNSTGSFDLDSIEVNRTSAWPFVGQETRVLVHCFPPGGKNRVFINYYMFRRIPSIVSGSVVYTMPRSNCTAMEAALLHTGQGRGAYISFIDSGKDRDAAALSTQTFSLGMAGEVFWQHACKNHMMVYRGAMAPEKDTATCCWVHVLQASTFLFGVYLDVTQAQVDLSLFRPLNRIEALEARAKKPLFAAFAFGKFRLDVYHGEYVVRHAFVKLLDDAVRPRRLAMHSLGHFTMPGLKAVGCPRPMENAVGCFSKYRFAIVMENSRINGYISEKILHAFFNHAVPIYFGPPDVDRYFNRKAMVVCEITDDEQIRLRSGHKASYSGIKVAGPLAVVAWASALLNNSLQHCVDQVLLLESDPEAYAAKLMQHPLVGGQVQRGDFDGYTSSCQATRCLAKHKASFLHQYDTAPALESCASEPPYKDQPMRFI